MLAFFYSLFLAIITGTWYIYSSDTVNYILGNTLNKAGSLLVNALGGKFETIQTFDIVGSGLSAQDILALVLAIVAVVIVCSLAFKLVKQVFSIFFGGR